MRLLQIRHTLALSASTVVKEHKSQPDAHLPLSLLRKELNKKLSVLSVKRDGIVRTMVMNL